MGAERLRLHHRIRKVMLEGNSVTVPLLPAPIRCGFFAPLRKRSFYVGFFKNRLRVQ